MTRSDAPSSPERAPDSLRAPSRRRWVLAAASALLAGSLLALARARLLAWVERGSPVLDDTLVEWRVAHGLGAEHALAIGLCALVAGAALVLARWARAVAAIAGVLLAAGFVLAGSPRGAPARSVLERLTAEPASATATPPPIVTEPVQDAALEEPERAGIAIPITVALLAGALAVGTVLAAARRAEHARAPLRGTPLLALTSVLALALPWVPRVAVARRAPRMVAREVVSELVLDPAAWSVESARPDGPPRAGVLAPCTDYRVDGADLPAIVMPPPCTLSFAVPADAERVWLRIAAGVPEELTKRLRPGDAPAFGFAIERNGERVFATRLEAHQKLAREERTWRRPPGGALELAGGDRVRLTTWIEGATAEEALAGPAYDVGFGDVVLERRRARERRPSGASTPNIVLVLQDTLRADRVSAYAPDEPTTPNVDRLAARGIRYAQAFSTASWTWPSTASILTGLHPDRHGVTDDSACYLAGANETLAEALQARGYTTAAFTCNPLITPQKNFDQGFELFDYQPQGFRKSDELLDSVLAWIDEHAGARFFLYLHLVDPHHPHVPRREDLARLGGTVAPEGWRGDRYFHETSTALLQGKGHDEHGRPIPDFVPAEHLAYWNELYDATVATGDHYVGAILDRLEWLGLDGETVVVFTSDHGEEWLDHGLLAHGQTLHRELVQVPLVLAGPGLPRGVVSTRAVSNRQIAPTLARFGGARLEAVDDPIDLAAPEASAEEPVYYATTHGWWNGRRARQPIYGIRDGRWVLHYAPEGADWNVPVAAAPPDGQVRLYDVASDPDEHRDVQHEHPEIAADLKARLLAHLERQVAERPSAQLGAGSATLEMLENIGYLGGDESDEGDER